MMINMKIILTIFNLYNHYNDYTKAEEIKRKDKLNLINQLITMARLCDIEFEGDILGSVTGYSTDGSFGSYSGYDDGDDLLVDEMAMR